MESTLIEADNYKYKSWKNYYPDYNVTLKDINIDSSWLDLFEILFDLKEFKQIEKILSLCLKKTNGEINIYPYPELIFSAFKFTPLNEIKVIILGQDPYHNCEYYNQKKVPQAMGLSFSVPCGVKIPSSLKNIYKNLVKFGHIEEEPEHGNLSFWAYQGVLLLNTSLTVQHGYANSHAEKWIDITDRIIEYLSRIKNNLIFVLWGSPALNKLELIDTERHKTIISSHPSGLSCNKQLRQYPAFMDKDHFGEINNYLDEHNKTNIIWNL